MSAEDAAKKKADLINILLPDEVQGDVYRPVDPSSPGRPGNAPDVLARVQRSTSGRSIAPPRGSMRPGRAEGAPATSCSEVFVKGGGVPVLIAVYPGRGASSAKSCGPRLCSRTSAALGPA